MIVVINPSNSAGHSFKGLHAYCAHDADQAETAERVDWISTRNIATDDPDQAWKVMVATAQAQDQLKQDAGVKAGRRSKHGPVMHVVMSFDQDEPQDRDTVEAAADELLSKLGADPAKMRGKSAPKTRQFADEHQVIMYAHNDRDHNHVHLMVNRVHPETGRNLPTNNDQLKAQNWALEFSKQHGTNHKTPAREENQAERDKGEYVKGERRKARNVYELEQKAKQASNDNDRVKAFLGEQRQKDASLALRSRNLAQLQARERQVIDDAHQARKDSLARQLRKELAAAKTVVRENFRLPRRELAQRQAAEQRTFEALEKSLFGRASNMARTVISGSQMRNEESGIIKRTFGILTNAGTRKEYFDKAQEREKTALASQQRQKLAEVTKVLKEEQAAKHEAARNTYQQEREDLAKAQRVKTDELREAWKERTADRQAEVQNFEATQERRAELLAQYKSNADNDPQDRFMERYSQAMEFQKAAERQELTQEQNNDGPEIDQTDDR